MKNIRSVLFISNLLVCSSLFAAEITPGKIDTFEDGNAAGWHRGPVSRDAPKVESREGNQFLGVEAFGASRDTGPLCQAVFL